MARVVAACALALLCYPRAASAEWQFTPMIGLTFHGNTTIVDPEQATNTRHKNFGGAVDLLSSDWVLGVEAITDSTPNFFQNSAAGLRKLGLASTVQGSEGVALRGNVGA